MRKIDYHHIGAAPEKDAERIRALYADAGIDDEIIKEFGPTVEAYGSSGVDAIIDRIATKYSGENPSTFGVLIVVDGVDTGQAIWGIKDYQAVDNETRQPYTMEGVNVSAWILQQYRGRGLGKALMKYASIHAAESLPMLGEARQIWTSIHSSNIASRSACARAGFSEIGVQSDKPDRLLYALKS